MGNIPIPDRRAIVVGVDGSPSSIAALQLAASLIPLAGNVIQVVAAWQYPVVFGLYTPMEWNYEELAERAECPVLVSHGALQLPEGEAIALPPVGASA